jgi:REP element-mobilizing transposase RayT
MPHTYSNLLTHVTLSTRDREPWLVDAIRDQVHAYLGGIVTEMRGATLMVGGTTDHVHSLLRLNCNLCIADCVRVLKTNSSRWIHEKRPQLAKFAWQIGYGAFSVSESSRGEVARYIQNQQQRHGKMSFQEEFLMLLRKHGIEFDERYLWR